jgi:glycosyltransferase involved in cell wall biosynthesis
MKVLQVCNKPPVPTVDGGCLAMHSMTEAFLHAHVSLQVLALETDKHPFVPEKMPPGYLKATNIEVVYVNTKINPVKAFINLFQESSYITDRFYSAEFEAKLIQLLEEESYDIVQLEGLYLTPYIDAIREKSTARIVLRAHNIESQLWERRTALVKNPLLRFWFGVLTEKLKHYEEDVIRKVDAIIPISEYDADTFHIWLRKKDIPIFTVPYCMTLPDKDETIKPTHRTVFHIGSMDWEPNIKGVKWFIKEVWPKVLDLVPDAQLHLAGRKMKKNDPEYCGDQITVHGEVEDALQFMQSFQVMIAPLFSGGGMKVKLIEGMATGKGIVTTPIGAEGIHMVHLKHAQITDNADDFANAVVRYFRNPGMLTDCSSNAVYLAQEEHDIKKSSQRIVDFYYSLIF